MSSKSKSEENFKLIIDNIDKYRKHEVETTIESLKFLKHSEEINEYSLIQFMTEVNLNLSLVFKLKWKEYLKNIGMIVIVSIIIFYLPDILGFMISTLKLLIPENELTSSNIISISKEPFFYTLRIYLILGTFVSYIFAILMSIFKVENTYLEYNSYLTNKFNRRLKEISDESYIKQKG